MCLCCHRIATSYWEMLTARMAKKWTKIILIEIIMKLSEFLHSDCTELVSVLSKGNVFFLLVLLLSIFNSPECNENLYFCVEKKKLPVKMVVYTQKDVNCVDDKCHNCFFTFVFHTSALHQVWGNVVWLVCEEMNWSWTVLNTDDWTWFERGKKSS